MNLYFLYKFIVILGIVFIVLRYHQHIPFLALEVSNNIKNLVVFELLLY